MEANTPDSLVPEHAALRREVGRLLRWYREAAGLSQERLGGRTGLDQPLISRIERGLYPADLTLIECLFGALDLALRIEVVRRER